MDTTIGTYCSFQITVCCPGQDNRESSKKNKNYQLLYPYGVPPDVGLQICPTHVVVFGEKEPAQLFSTMMVHKHLNMQQKRIKYMCVIDTVHLAGTEKVSGGVEMIQQKQA